MTKMFKFGRQFRGRDLPGVIFNCSNAVRILASQSVLIRGTVRLRRIDYSARSLSDDSGPAARAAQAVRQSAEDRIECGVELPTDVFGQESQH